jgi:hypothetical protein
MKCPASIHNCVHFCTLEEGLQRFQIGHTSEQINLFSEGQTLQGVGILYYRFMQKESIVKKEYVCTMQFVLLFIYKPQGITARESTFFA